jgi:hypothetical protein
VIFTDLDSDAWPDIFVGNDSVPNVMFRNNQDGTFSEVGLASGLALSGDGKAQAGMGADAADYDADGRMDVFVTNFSQDHNTLHHHAHDGLFSNASYEAGVVTPGLPYMGSARDSATSTRTVCSISSSPMDTCTPRSTDSPRMSSGRGRGAIPRGAPLSTRHRACSR